RAGHADGPRPAARRPAVQPAARLPGVRRPPRGAAGMSELPPRVLRARMQLMLAHPYLACALARLPVVNAAALEWCRTMATDGYSIYVRPPFGGTLREAGIPGVFAHGVLHGVRGPLDRRGDRQRGVWNVAVDHATNLLLTDFGFRLPANGYSDRRFAG